MEYILVLMFLMALSNGWNTCKVNGMNVDIADFPWQGSYRRASGSHACGCVFVGGRVVLTAAHCGGNPSHTMEFGATMRGSGTVFSISSVTFHPLYGAGPGFAPNDLAIVLSSRSIHGRHIAPGRIAPSEDNPGGRALLSRWGRTCGSCPLPLSFHPLRIDVISDEECGERWGESFQSDSMICVYDGQRGACHGDSGGPLSIGSTIYGLSSWGASGCNVTFPSVYTRVGSYRTWVCDVTENEPLGC